MNREDPAGSSYSRASRRAVAIAWIAAAACGGGGSDESAALVPADESASAPAPSPPAGALPPAGNDVPDAVLTDVDTGEDVNLRSLIPAEKPILFWFWAPT